MNIKLSKLYSILAQLEMTTRLKKLDLAYVKGKIKSADSEIYEDVILINSNVNLINKNIKKNKYSDCIDSLTYLMLYLSSFSTELDNLNDEIKNVLENSSLYKKDNNNV